jgi:hypothetical protein
VRKRNIENQGLSMRRIVLALGLAVATSSVSAQQQPVEPFTASMRWSQYLHRTYDPFRLASLAVDTAIDHVMREPACWDSGAASYGRRYGRSLERRIVRNTTEMAAGLLTGEDLRYRMSRSSSMKGRVWHAVRSSVTAQMPDGTSRPAYTRFFAGAVTGVATGNWTRDPIRPARLGQSLAWSALDQVQTNMMTEFGPDMRRFGMRVWKRVRPH